MRKVCLLWRRPLRAMIFTLMSNLPPDSPEEYLSSLPLFRDLTAHQLAEVWSVLHRQEVTTSALLITQEQAGEAAYLIVEGSFKVCTQGPGGEVIVAVRGPGEILGEMSMIDNFGRSATVIAQEPSVVLRVSRVDFWCVLWEIQPVPYNMTCILAQRLRVLSAQVQALNTLDVQGRLARQLVLLAEEYGQPPAEDEAARSMMPSPERRNALYAETTGPLLIPFHLTQKGLADMIGSSREQVNGLLSAWKRRQYITVDGSRLTINNRDALRRFYELG